VSEREREREREKLYKYVLVMTQFEWEVLSQSETIWEGTKIMTLKKKKTLSSSCPFPQNPKRCISKAWKKQFKIIIIIIKLLFPNCYLKFVHRKVWNLLIKIFPTFVSILLFELSYKHFYTLQIIHYKSCWRFLT